MIFVFHRGSWLSLSSALALLLVLSVLGNVGLLLQGRWQHRDHRYLPLRDINGDTPHSPTTSAAWDHEDVQEPEDPQEPEDTQDPNQELL